jgi:hypothetical protein
MWIRPSSSSKETAMSRTYEPTNRFFFFQKIKEILDPNGKSLPDIIDADQILSDDLSKVKFDWENYECENTYGSFDDFWPLLGLHRWYVDGGYFNFLGCMAGGDWETPVFFIIYYDGEKLRGYIPKEGNPWNRTTKQAYGNNENADLKDMIEHGFADKLDDDDYEPCPSYDLRKIRGDILGRIKRKK